MNKLVAIDLDGTMLNQYGVVTQKTKEAIERAQLKGIEVIIASGRPIDSIKTIAKEINSNKYFISGNGAIVYDIANDQIIYENTLKKQKTLDIIKICEENSIYYNIYTEKEILAKSLQANVLYYNKENLNKEEKDKTHINIVSDIYHYIQERDEKVLKITVCDSSKSIFNSRKMIKQGTEDVPIEYFYTEISAKNVDKWNALQVLKNKMQIAEEQIVTIGDNLNDKMMIEKAKLGIAMGQSTPYVKEIADKITYSNIEDGVAYALDNLI